MNANTVNDHGSPADVRSEAQPAATLAAGPKVGFRHTAITNDLYSYQRYKTWMNKARAGWKES